MLQDWELLYLKYKNAAGRSKLKNTVENKLMTNKDVF